MNASQPQSSTQTINKKLKTIFKPLYFFYCFTIVITLIGYLYYLNGLTQNSESIINAATTTTIELRGRSIPITFQAKQTLDVMKYFLIVGIPIAIFVGIAGSLILKGAAGLMESAPSILNAKCPRCRIGLIHSAFLTLNRRCSECELDFDPEPGFMLGALYFNYGMSIAIGLPTCLLLFVSKAEVLTYLFVVSAEGVLLGPFIVRYSRILWLHFNHWISPEKVRQ